MKAEFFNFQFSFFKTNSVVLDWTKSLLGYVKLSNYFFGNPQRQKNIFPIICILLLINVKVNAQTEIPRVSFSVSNSSKSRKYIDFRSYSTNTKTTAGYGYSLGGLSSHTVDLPAPVRVYEERNGKKELLFVVTEKDNGKDFSVNQTYLISKEQLQQVANDEMNEKLVTSSNSKDEKGMEQIAKDKGLQLITVNFKGSSWFSSMVHVRYQLPWEVNKSQTGFSTSLSKFKNKTLTLPIGTKVYQCSDKFWSQQTKYTEKLIITIDKDQEEKTFQL
ncbi:MAG: hypothetical protein MUF58_03920 [Arcicella sp.]|jgi:hypothetical protein|nr:hypothetical protein [Arcicella sp.]